MSAEERLRNEICIRLSGDVALRLAIQRYLKVDARRITEVWLLAAHECAHAIVAAHFGEPTVLIEIGPDGGKCHSKWETVGNRSTSVSDRERIETIVKTFEVCRGEVPDLAEREALTERILGDAWEKLECLARNLVNRISGQDGTWRAELPGKTIRLLLMSPAEFQRLL